MNLNISSRPRHNRFVKTPVINDVLHLSVYQKGQWIKLAWCDKPSRFHSISSRGNVIAFHYPKAAIKFANFCEKKPVVCY